jgi:MarR family transcriptional regulator, temperature-dependent positive regulator of motility
LTVAAEVFTQKSTMSSRAVRRRPAISDELRAILIRERGWFGFRIALWGSYFATPLFADMQRRHGLLRDEFAILASLHDYGALTAKTICVITGRPKNSISRAVTRLTATGRIRSVVNAADRREAILSLRAAGRRLYAAILPMCRERERRMLRPLTGRQQAQLDQILAKLLNFYHLDPRGLSCEFDR